MKPISMKKQLADYLIALEDYDSLASIGTDLLHTDKTLRYSKYLSLEDISVSTESIIDDVQKFFKAVIAAALKFWKMIVGFAVKFGQLIKKIMGGIASYAKSFFSREDAIKAIAIEAKRIIEGEQQKPDPDMDTVKSVVNKVVDIVGGQETTEIQTTSEAMNIIDEITAAPARVDLSNIQYTIDQEYFNLFGYDKNIEVFTVNQIERQRKLNDHYFRLVEVAKENLNADVFVETLKKLSTDKITAKQLRRAVCDEMIEPFFTVDKVEDTDNLSPDNRIDVMNQTVKQYYKADTSSNPINTFRKAIKSLGGQLLPADVKRFVKATPIKTNRATMKVMLETIQNTIKSIEQNRMHLYVNEKQIHKGFMLTEDGLRHLLRDLKLDKNPHVKQLANIIIDLARTVDTLINQQHHTWLMLTNAQIVLLNKQMKAIMSAKPILLS